jgi:hypothetical protein
MRPFRSGTARHAIAHCGSRARREEYSCVLHRAGSLGESGLEPVAPRRVLICATTVPPRFRRIRGTRFQRLGDFSQPLGNRHHADRRALVTE